MYCLPWTGTVIWTLARNQPDRRPTLSCPISIRLIFKKKHTKTKKAGKTKNKTKTSRQTNKKNTRIYLIHTNLLLLALCSSTVYTNNFYLYLKIISKQAFHMPAYTLDCQFNSLYHMHFSISDVKVRAFYITLSP